MKKNFSKLFAVLMAVMMVFTMMPGMAFADTGSTPATAEVYLTISDQGVLASDRNGSVMANRPVTVTDLNGDGKFTYDEALTAAHAAYNSADGYTAVSTVSKLWGKENPTESFLFFTNNEGLPDGVKSDNVSAGDYLTASVNATGEVPYTNWYAYFNTPELSTKAGSEFTLTLKGFLGMAYTPEDKTPVPLEGISIGLWENGVFKDFETPAVTGTDGTVTLSFDTVGTYYITAKGTVTDEVSDWSTYPPAVKNAECPIIAPVCVVTVTNEAPDATVYMTVNNQGVIGRTSSGAPMAGCEVTVKDIDKNGVLTYHEALIAAHKEYMTEADYTAAEGAYGLSVSRLWGVDTTNTLFYKNHTALGYSVGDTENSAVQEGDHLTASVNKDNIYYSDRYAKFDTAAKKVSMGEEFTLDLDVNVSGEAAFDKIQIGTWEDGVFVPLEGKTFDAEGKVTLIFDQAGTYYVTACGTAADTVTDYSNWPATSQLTYDCPIMAPVCVVTVPSKDLSGLTFTSGNSSSRIIFELAPEFSKDTAEYNLYFPAASSSIYVLAELAENAEGAIAVKYTNTKGAETTKAITSGASSAVSLSSVLTYNSMEGTTLDVTVGGTSRYTVQVVRIGALKKLTAASGAEGSEAAVALSPSFSSTKYAYTAKIDADDKIVFTPGLIDGTEVTVNGTAMENGTITVTPQWKADRTFTAEVKVQAEGNTDPKAVGNYTIVFEQYPESIAITKAPAKTQYTFGEAFEKTGMEVTATYKDGGTKIISAADLTVTPAEPLTDETEVTVTYENQTVKQPVTVASVFEGEGTEESPYLIRTVEEMVTLSGIVAGGTDFDGKFIRMDNDITLPDAEGDDAWVPLGTSKTAPFSGSFDGNHKTITVPEGGLPLFGCVKNAEIKNLDVYGKKIAGYGLVNGYQQIGNTTTTIENVTLKTGSSTLQAGFIGGYASGSDQIIIRNCTVEKDVIIGYDKAQKWIGSFGGEFNGIIENCVSYASVYGSDFVGGIAANKGQSMGTFKVTNCQFYGTVEATGNYVGGIVGHGYGGTGWGFTNNAPCVTIENCLAAGTVKGADYVGGIFGGDIGVAQYWDNGTGYIRNNHFYGTVTATGTDAYAGGIIGYMKTLNKNSVIENNYYLDSCGADTGIGGVIYVDTNCTSHETASGATYFDTSQGKPGITGVTKTNMNRTDDPLGADAETLTKSMAAAKFKDGTVKDLLNLSDSSAHNWIQGTDYPVHSTEPIVYQLIVSEGYVKDYYIGDALDLGSAEITAVWTGGEKTPLSADDVTITGFDSKTRGQKTVTISYGTASTQIVVVVLEKVQEEQNNTIKVFFKLMGDTAHGEDGIIHTMADGNLTTWINESYTLDKNSTVEDLLNLVDEEHSNLNIIAEWNGKYGTSYIEGVKYGDIELYEFTNGNLSGWKYTVNGKYPEVGVSAYYLDNYDSIVFHYTDDYTKESDAKQMTGGVIIPEGGTNEVITSKENDEKINITTTPTEVAVSGSTATATITKENVAETIKQATENKSAEIVLQVSASESKGAATVKVQLDTTTVKDVVNKTAAALTVKTENAVVTLDRETLKTVAAEAAGSTITLEVVEVAKPTAAHKEAAGENGHVIQLVIKSGNKVISLFNEGKATVTVEIPTKLDGKKVAAIHIGDDGKVEHLKGQEVTVDGKKHYRFDTPHFSTFALVDADEIGLEVEEQMTADEVKVLLADLTPAVRSVKTAKKNVKLTLKLDAADKAIIEELEAAGYTVKYNFYRSTKKSSKYESMLIKEGKTYTNTKGKKGEMYYYKARVQVYDAEGKLIARTALKDCWYANRKWTN